MNFIGAFEAALTAEAQRLGADRVICGHIHHAAMRDMGQVRYLNTGDWVESCTAIVETFEGEFIIVRWAEEAARTAPAPVEVSQGEIAPA